MNTRSSYGEQPSLILRCFDLKSSKISVMGDDDSGKTSLVRSWLNNSFQITDSNHYRVSDLYHKTVQFDSLIKYCRTLEMKSQMPNISESDISRSEMKESNTTVQNRSDMLEEYIKKAITSDNKPITGRPMNIDVQIFDTNRMEVSYHSELTTIQIKQSDAIVLCFDSTNANSFASLESYICIIHQVSLECQRSIPIIIACTKCDLTAERSISYDKILAFLRELNFSPNGLDYFEISSKLDANIEDLLFAALLKIGKSKNDRRERLQGVTSKNRSANNLSTSPSGRNTCDIKAEQGVIKKVENISKTASSVKPKSPGTKDIELLPIKKSLTENLTTRRSIESLPNAKKKKFKKCITACCVM